MVYEVSTRSARSRSTRTIASRSSATLLDSSSNTRVLVHHHQRPCRDGRDFSDRRILSTDNPTLGSCPTMLRVSVAGYDETVPGGWYQMETLCVELFEDGEPVWYEHPTLGHECDVIAIDVDWPKHQSRLWHRAINRVSDVRIPVQPAYLCSFSVTLLASVSSLACRFGNPVISHRNPISPYRLKGSLLTTGSRIRLMACPRSLSIAKRGVECQVPR